MKIEDMKDINKIKIIFSFIGKDDKKKILTILYKHKQEIGFTDDDLLLLAKTPSLDHSSEIKDIIENNLNKYDDETLNMSIQELKKHIDKDDIENILSLKILPNRIKKIIGD